MCPILLPSPLPSHYSWEGHADEYCLTSTTVHWSRPTLDQGWSSYLLTDIDRIGAYWQRYCIILRAKFCETNATRKNNHDGSKRCLCSSGYDLQNSAIAHASVAGKHTEGSRRSASRSREWTLHSFQPLPQHNDNDLYKHTCYNIAPTLNLISNLVTFVLRYSRADSPPNINCSRSAEADPCWTSAACKR